jgi:hypothetical protein
MRVAFALALSLLATHAYAGGPAGTLYSTPRVRLATETRPAQLKVRFGIASRAAADAVRAKVEEKIIAAPGQVKVRRSLLGGYLLTVTGSDPLFRPGDANQVMHDNTPIIKSAITGQD